jgi:hypothetical protein
MTPLRALNVNELAREWWDTLLEITAAAYQEEDIEDAKVAHVEATRALLAYMGERVNQDPTIIPQGQALVRIARDLLPDEEEA